MDASMTTPATEESFSPTAKPSIALLRADVSQPPETQPLEYSHDTVKTLEEAIRGGDVPTTCQLLEFLNEQYSRTIQNHGPPEEPRRIWNCAIEVLKEHPIRETRVLACQLLKTLAETGKSGWRNKASEFLFLSAMPKDVVESLKLCGHDLEIRSLLLKMLLSMSRCSDCRSTYDPEGQLLLRQSEVNPVLLESLNVLMHLTTRMPFDPTGHRAARLAIADVIQTLHYVCFMNKENLLILASLEGFKAIKMSIEDNLNELTVQEHGCMILSELAISAELTKDEIMECLSTVTNVARVQIQEKYIEVARAAVWSLYRMARCVLHPSRRGSGTEQQQPSLLSHIWVVIIQGETLNLVLGMMQSCQLKNDLLVKHCLDFIAVVSESNGSPPSPSNPEFIQNLQKAYSLVFRLFVESTDLGIKAVALRTLCCLVNNAYFFCQEDESLMQLEAFFECLNLVKTSSPTSQTNIFLIQVFALNIISALVENISYGGLMMKLSVIDRYIEAIFLAVGFILQYTKVGEGVSFRLSNEDEIMARIRDQKRYKHDCHHFLHEPCKKSKMLNSVFTAIELLCLNGSCNITDNEGLSIVHKLAKTGQGQILKGVLEVYGTDLDMTQSTKDGKTALELAMESQNLTCVSILESGSVQETKQERNECLQGLDQEQENFNIRREKLKQVFSVLFNSEERFIFTDPPPSPRTSPLISQDQETTLTSTLQTSMNPSLAGQQSETNLLPTEVSRRTETGFQNPFWSATDEEGLLRKSSSSKSATTSVNLGPQFPETSQVQFQSFGTSLSAGSRYNNYTACAPAGPYEEYTNLEPVSDLKGGSSEDRTSTDWQSLYTEESTQLGPKEKWSMVSSSSGQNNQTSMEHGVEAVDNRGLTVRPMTGQSMQRTGPEGMPPAWHGGPGRILEHQEGEEDFTDDKQILSWMSSEIFGLIGSGPEDTEEIKQNSTNLENDQFPLTQGMLESFDSPEEPSCSSFLAIDPTVSPFYSAKLSNAVPYGQSTAPQLQMSFPVGTSPWMNTPMVSNPIPVPDPRLLAARTDTRTTEGVHPSRFWHTEENDIPSKHLWLGNLNTRLPRSVLKSIFEEYGPIEDVVTFPGRMYAFVNFIRPEDAQRAAKELDNLSLPVLTGSRKLVIKFRPNRKALGRVGDLMPGVGNIDSSNDPIMPPSISVPVFCSQDAIGGSYPGLESSPEVLPQQGGLSMDTTEETSDPEQSNTQLPPSRHLWLGNVCLRPSKIVLFSLFSRYGPVQSVRVFPGKTFAFVNFCNKEHSTKAKEALDQKVIEPITGTKPLVVRFQREGAGQTPWTRSNPTENTSSFQTPSTTDLQTNNQPDPNKSYLKSLSGALEEDPRTLQGSLSSMGVVTPALTFQQSLWNEGNPYGLMTGLEMPSMGELAHSQSAAAAYGRPQNHPPLDPSLSFQSQQGLPPPPPPPQTPWNQYPLMDGNCLPVSTMISNPDFGFSLQSSFSGGPDGKGYFTPFRNPHFPLSQSWNATEKTAGMANLIDPNSANLNVLGEQQQHQYQPQHQHFTIPSSHVGVHSSLPEEILISDNSSAQFPAENYEMHTSPTPETTQAALMPHQGGSIW